MFAFDDNMKSWLSTLILFVATVFATNKFWEKILLNRRLPPGPLANWIPIVGYVPFLKLRRCEAHDVLCELAKKYGKIFHLKLGSVILIVITDHKLFRDVLAREDMCLRSLPASMDVMDGLGIVHANGEKWKNQRQFVQTVFRSLGVGRNMSHPQGTPFEEKTMKAIGLLLTEVARKEGKPFDIEFYLAYTVSCVFYSTVMNAHFEPNDPDLMEQIAETRDSFRIQEPYNIGNFLPFFRRFSFFKDNVATVIGRRDASRNFFRKIVAEKRLTINPNDPTPDLIHAYLMQMDKSKNDENSHFTELQLLSIMGDLTSAGLETTKTTILWIILALLNKPAVQTKIQEELDNVIGREKPPMIEDRPRLKYVEATILETLRFSSILPLGINHTSEANAKVEGYLVPRDASVTGIIWKFHRDARYWKNPHEFDPQNHISADGTVSRSEYLVPFSTGRRICIGEEIARNEIFLIITGLLQRFTLLPIEGEKLPSLDESVIGVLRYPLPFKLRAILRY